MEQPFHRGFRRSTGRSIMSWSFYAVGKPAAVLAKARTDFSRITCSEPEETIKGKVLNILEASLLAMPESSAVSIKAMGSQVAGSDGKATNNLSVSIEPMFGFVE
jgi:hypothetical protein